MGRGDGVNPCGSVSGGGGNLVVSVYSGLDEGGEDGGDDGNDGEDEEFWRSRGLDVFVPGIGPELRGRRDGCGRWCWCGHGYGRRGLSGAGEFHLCPTKHGLCLRNR